MKHKLDRPAPHASASRQYSRQVLTSSTDEPERSVLIFDVAANGIVIVANQPQRLFYGRIAVAEGTVRAVVALAIANVNVGDAIVVFADEIDNIVVSRGKVAGIEGHEEILGHGQGLLKTLRGGELIGIDEIVVVVHGDEHAVLLNKRDQALGLAENGG